jgi:hypothetical protein
MTKQLIISTTDNTGQLNLGASFGKAFIVTNKKNMPIGSDSSYPAIK